MPNAHSKLLSYWKESVGMVATEGRRTRLVLGRHVVGRGIGSAADRRC